MEMITNNAIYETFTNSCVARILWQGNMRWGLGGMRFLNLAYHISS